MKLDHMPKEIFVRIEKATWIWSKDLGPGVIGVKPTAVIWHTDPKDKVGVRRRGFQIAPDFSGTAHSFAGASLKSVLIDILEWHRKPSKDDQISAYMCVSRIQHIDDLCIMQPYAPTLFQQGELDGPDLLLRFLRGDVPLKDLQREWAAMTKQNKKEEWKSASDIPLYCRGCSAKTGEIVENKKANKFPHSAPDRIWEDVVSLGMERFCNECRPGGGQIKTIDQAEPEPSKDANDKKCAYCNKAPIVQTQAKSGAGYCTKCMSTVQVKCQKCSKSAHKVVRLQCARPLQTGFSWIRRKISKKCLGGHF